MATTLSSYLLTALVLSLGFGQLLRFDLPLGTLYLHDLLLLAYFGLNLRQLPRALSYFSVHFRLLIWGLLLGSLVGLYLYGVTALPLIGLYSARFLSYLTLYCLLLVQSRAPAPHAMYLAFFITLTLGLTQYFALPDMRWAQYLGWDDHLHRLTLPHYDPSFTAVILGMMVLTLPRLNFLLKLAAALALLLTYARSAYISLFATILLSLKNRILSLLLILLLGVGIFLLPQRFGEGNNLLRTYSITSRYQADITYLRDLNFWLLTGVGYGALAHTASLDSPLPNHANSPNNSYLHTLAAFGVLGLIEIGKFFLHLYHQKNLRPLLVFFLIASLFNNVLYYPFTLLWLLLAYTRAPTST